MGTRCLGVYLPRVYKYGGLALQFRVWTTGRQLVTVKKLTVKKPELWPGNRLGEIDLGSGKESMR
jgi:hypothetical protein